MWSMYRRNLPHWRSGTDATYFVTWRIDRQREDLDPAERSCVADTLRRGHGRHYELVAYVVMNDHVHVIANVFGSAALQDVVQAWKSITAHKLRKGSTGRVWQSEYLDRIIRNEAELDRQTEYVIGNPFARWPSLIFYPWVWAAALDEE